ncbi:MAG: DUF3592 domain-containing protein [Pseudomonadota bacterium]
MTLMMFVLGILLVLTILASLWLGFNSSQWPTTQGKILKAGLSEAQNPHSSADRTFYRPSVLYEYTRHSQPIRSTRIGAYLIWGTNRQKAEQVIRHFQEGSAARVYYHPYLPKLSVLDPGIKQPWVHILLLAIGLLIATVTGLPMLLDISITEWLFNLIHSTTQ